MAREAILMDSITDLFYDGTMETIVEVVLLIGIAAVAWHYGAAR